MTYLEYCAKFEATKQNRLSDGFFDYIHDKILCDENYFNIDIELIESEKTIIGGYKSIYYNKLKNYYFDVNTFEKRF